MRPKTVDLARGRWKSVVLPALGVPNEYLSGRHSGCPLCGQGKDTFRFDDKDGNGTYFCGKCGAGRGMDFVMKWEGLDWPQAAKRVDEILGEVQPLQPPTTPKRDPKPGIDLITNGSKSLTGTDPASVYLRNRGLSVISPELMWNPSVKYWEVNNEGFKELGQFPAMVAPVRNVSGELVTYHITYLSKGAKAKVPDPKKVKPPLCEKLSGEAIQLFPAGKQLAVAEGIETALAFYEVYQTPVWATCNANQMERLVIPDCVEELTIVADNDESFTGQAAAYALAKKAVNTGRAVKVILEGMTGQDYLDIFNEKNQRGYVA